MSSDERGHGPARRHILRAGAVAGLTAAGMAVAAAPALAAPGRAGAGRPRIEFGGSHAREALLGGAYRAALDNLLDINTVPYDPAEYNQTGLMTDPPGVFIRAGGGYEQPWTRDASVNSWNAASLLSPDVARNTLWSVCRRQDDGTLVVQQDNQWWDQIVWVIAARNHYLTTGDRRFVTDAHQAALNTLRLNRDRHFNEEYGLFEGPAFMQDGIAGYPSPPYDPENGSSFVLDHPDTDTMMCLSTNCLYHAAYLACADMSDVVGDRSVAGELRGAAARLRTAIDSHLWRPEADSYGYLIHGSGERVGQLETYQEGNGLAFAVLCGVASRARTHALLRTTHRQPRGVVNVYPHFSGFDDERPGRHNVIVWPMTVGMWGHAAAVGGRVDLFGQAVVDIATLQRPDGHFWEIYNAKSGAVDGGWQNERQWESEEDQTWSATGYLRLIHQGLFGMRFEHDGLRFTPSLPAGWGPVTLRDLCYRDMTLDITLTGSGKRVVSTKVDGRRADTVPAGLRGRHHVRIQLA
ncbi:MGH1-like glycoside hydrolase domain-containing protein [Streptomyces sp. NPDC051217]|uniref:MGH1-like glycoside hydrolase domain-containing protein n=1 Tax=Streptomyces sp. NPDC051217 TaxID=3365644 RepID=UPI0037A6F90D